jgi:hypothetical protein
MTVNKAASPSLKEQNMGTQTLSQKRYLQAAQVFHWATQDHFTLWFTGSTKRYRRTEAVLPRLVKKGSLVATKYGKKMVYACPRRVRQPGFFLKVDHGLGCTEGLIRFWWSDMRAEIIEERFFYGCGSVPEWGLRYESKKMILFEYCTADNFNRTNVIKSKLAAYQNNLETINRRFKVDSIIIFVCDVPRDKITKLVLDNKPIGLPAFFTDTEMFTRISIGKQLEAPIYIWGEDGLAYPLVNHA